jgi:phenylalanyl-tRNA synthetase alpha chain
MGFKEFNYNFILQEFWNFDILFQAQDHPSREIHDTFWLDYSSDTILDASPDLVEKVKRIHEKGGSRNIRGWGGEWRESVARRYILRTQMTSATIRALSTRPSIPFRIFSIGKVYRPDQVDYKRLPEFTQLDGIISESGFTFKDLLSVLKDFFTRLGFEKVKFKPAYFPFTEPSVEGYVYMEERGWVEVFGAGLFRPEILEVLGYTENVGAWGMGLERLAMKLIGVEDIRLFYSREIDVLRKHYSKALRALGE